MEVEPGKAVALRSIWPIDNVGVLMPTGTRFFSPLFWKRFTDVDLQNQPFDPEPASVIMQDGVELEFDYVFDTFCVGDWPNDRAATEEAVVKAVSRIDYGKRKELVLTRLAHYIQAAVAGFTSVDATGNGKVNFLQQVENSINTALQHEWREWGIRAHVESEDINRPAALRAASEAEAAAGARAQALRKIAEGQADAFKKIGDVTGATPDEVVKWMSIQGAAEALKGALEAMRKGK